MNAQEQELLEALRAEFAVEALEHLQTISSGLLSLEQGGSPEREPELLEQIYRNAHNLKGEARAVNYAGVETLCQALESVLAGWKNSGAAREKPAFDLLHSTLDSIRRMITAPDAVEDGAVASLVSRLGALASGAATPVPAADGGKAGVSPASGKPEIHPEPGETIRLPAHRIEALLIGLEQMLSVKLAAHVRAETLRTALAQIEQWRREAARVRDEVIQPGATSGLPPRLVEWMNGSREAIAGLESALAALAGEADVDDVAVGRLVDTVLGDSKKLMLTPFNTLLGAIPKMVRDLAGEQGKEIDVVIRGGEIEVDKRMFQELKDAVIHLVRNCVDHGIESVEQRRRRGKPDRGAVTVEVLPVDAGKVELVIRDDGAGINLEAVKAAAARLGLVTRKEADALSRDEVLAMIFRSSVSTRREVTAVSGRGLGMAIVKERVEKLGGRITIESEAGAGSTFRIGLPVALATFRGTFVEIMDQCFVIPSTRIERVGRFRRQEVKAEGSRRRVTLAARTLDYVRLGECLGLGEPDPGDPFQMFVMIAESGDRRVVFGVDKVLYEDEVLVKSFSKPLSRVRHVSGATVLPSGRIVPVLNVTDLLKSAERPGAYGGPARPPVPVFPSRGRPHLLVVEDSIISRALFKSILESAGYAVKTAVDGAEAWEALQGGAYDAVVSDVDMPRMSGIELVAHIRGDARLRGMPVILVTGCESPEDRARGREAGATEYLVKSSFDQSDLLEALRKVV